jgi:hypothetical protein
MNARGGQMRSWVCMGHATTPQYRAVRSSRLWRHNEAQLEPIERVNKTNRRATLYPIIDDFLFKTRDDESSRCQFTHNAIEI